MSIDDPADLAGLMAAGRVVRVALEAMRDAVRPGVSTRALDDVAARVFAAHGARSAPILVYGFPGATCISVNDEIVHGIPSGRVLRDGDLVKLDVTVEKDGYMADAALSVGVGRLAARAAALAACAERALAAGLAEARAGNRVRDIGRAVERLVRADGFHVVRPLTGHGIGRTIHEDPLVPNYDDPDATMKLTDGLVITVEPIIAAGTGRMRELGDGWTIVTGDGDVAAHAEHTIVVRRGAPQILTAAAEPERDPARALSRRRPSAAPRKRQKVNGAPLGAPRSMGVRSRSDRPHPGEPSGDQRLADALTLSLRSSATRPDDRGPRRSLLLVMPDDSSGSARPWRATLESIVHLHGPTPSSGRPRPMTPRAAGGSAGASARG